MQGKIPDDPTTPKSRSNFLPAQIVARAYNPTGSALLAAITDKSSLRSHPKRSL